MHCTALHCSGWLVTSHVGGGGLVLVAEGWCWWGPARGSITGLGSFLSATPPTTSCAEHSNGRVETEQQECIVR
jgi:hypothetical protein